jgi:hypothetical protein
MTRQNINLSKPARLALAAVAASAAILIIALVTQPPAKPYNTVDDSSTGLKFNMSKRFEPIPRDKLAAMNPSFTYGFKSPSDPAASCIVSQTKLASTGNVPPASVLRDGLLGEIKKTHPDVKLDNKANAGKLVKFGSAYGALLEMTYSDKSDLIKRVETLAVSKTSQLTAFCQSRSADNSKYYQDFTVFFSSLELNK